MKNNIIEMKQINKRYSRHQVLENVSFDIKAGQICGLIGENGAGKTTLIRILSGLIRMDSGEIVGLAHCNISSIVEAPSLHLNLSAFANLKYQLLLCGVSDSNEKIIEILKLVGLQDVDQQKKVKDYSLGMKQRLAIGLAIVDSPDLLILDEPINGLDPRGIKDIRNILSTLKNRFNMTILISSHILAELDLVADYYVIMSKGKVVKEILRDDIQSYLGNKIILECDSQTNAVAFLINKGCECTPVKNKIEIVESKLSVPQIIDVLREQNIEINAIYTQRLSFEDYYLNLIEGKVT